MEKVLEQFAPVNLFTYVDSNIFPYPYFCLFTLSLSFLKYIFKSTSLSIGFHLVASGRN